MDESEIVSSSSSSLSPKIGDDFFNFLLLNPVWVLLKRMGGN